MFEPIYKKNIDEYNKMYNELDILSQQFIKKVIPNVENIDMLYTFDPIKNIVITYDVIKVYYRFSFKPLSTDIYNTYKRGIKDLKECYDDKSNIKFKEDSIVFDIIIKERNKRISLEYKYVVNKDKKTFNLFDEKFYIDYSTMLTDMNKKISTVCDNCNKTVLRKDMIKQQYYINGRLVDREFCSNECKNKYWLNHQGD